METIELHYGKLKLNQFGFYVKNRGNIVTLSVNDIKHSDFKFDPDSGKLTVSLNEVITEGKKLQISVSIS